MPVHVRNMAESDPRSDDVLTLRRSDRDKASARSEWAPLAYAVFASVVMLIALSLGEWLKIPSSTKRDAGAAIACQLHIRAKLPPEPALQPVDLAIQPFTGVPGPRSVFIAYRAKGRDGRPIRGMQRCAFETEPDGNFPPLKELTRAVFRSEGEMHDWKDRFLRGEPVRPLAQERPECCLPMDDDGENAPVPGT